MNLKPEYRATTKDGFKLIGMDGKTWTSELKRMFPETDLTITVQKRRKQRSNQQNRYYWSCIVPMVREGFRDLGHVVDNTMIHDFLKSKFIEGVEIISEITGEVVTVSRSTTTLSTSEMMDYQASIQMWAAEFLGIDIPDPEEQTTIFK